MADLGQEFDDFVHEASPGCTSRFCSAAARDTPKTCGQGTNCTSNLHLTADETTRLITTPDAACPLLIKSVLTALPAGVIKDEASSNSGVRRPRVGTNGFDAAQLVELEQGLHVESAP
jgi:hypothetical protein